MDGHYENTMFITEGIDLALRSLRFDGVKDMKVLRIGYYEFTSNETSESLAGRVSGWPLGACGRDGDLGHAPSLSRTGAHGQGSDASSGRASAL